jgi:tripartite-type tricarboxylate transporter receptor subunit TctC
MRSPLLSMMLVAGALMPMLACAQSYPVKAVRLIVPYAAGGAADAAGRLAAQKLSDGFGQPVIVENRVGGGTTIGAAVVAAAPPDGYTLLMAGLTGHIVSGIVYRNLAYHPVKSFEPAAMLSDAPFILAVSSASRVQTPKELIELSKARPNGLTYGSSGTGAGPHLATEMLARATGANLVHVPYKGSAPAMLALLSGEVDMAILDISAMNQVNAGKLRALAQTAATRSPLAPAVPTLAETGISGVEVPSGQGLLAPAGTPREVILRINSVINRALATDEVRKSFESRGFMPAPNTPEAFGAFLQSEYQKYLDLTKRINLVLD